MKTPISLFVMCIALFYCQILPTQAQNRGTAYAIPISGISIDGNLEDWPGEMFTFPIDWVSPIFHKPTPPEGPEDFSANFMVGYDSNKNVLYVAVVVTDDDIVVAPIEEADLRTQDACGIYIDADHSGGGIEVVGHQLYIMVPGDGKWTKNQDANPSLNKGNTKASGMKGAYTITNNTIIYEWEIPLFNSYPEIPHQVKAGNTIGFDFLIADADGDELANFIVWTPEAGKSRTADLFGDLVFLDSYDQLGAITGIVSREEDKSPQAGKIIDVFYEDELWETLKTDLEGQFHLQVQPGEYIVNVRMGQGFLPVEEMMIKVGAGEQTRVDFSTSPIIVPKKFAQSLDYYKSMSSYEDVTTIERVIKQTGLENTMTTELLFAFERPNRLKLASLISLPYSMEAQVFCDGEKFVSYMDTLNQYKVEDAPKLLSEKTRQYMQSSLANYLIMSVDPHREIISELGGVKKLGNENLDGNSTEVIELLISLAHLESNMPQPVKDLSLMIPVKMWIGKKDKLIHQLFYTLDMEKLMSTFSPGGDVSMDDIFKGMKMDVTEKHSNIEINPVFSKSDFIFEPPEGASLVEEFNRPMPKKSELIGKSAPGFTLMDLDGAEVKLSDFKGKVVLIDFWATWCGPCVQAMPQIQSLFENYKGKDVVILGINSWERAQDRVKPFLEEQNITYRILVDLDNEVIAKFRVTGIPTFFIIDKKGIIRHSHIGLPSDENIIQKNIDELLVE
jgi:thiol-disulfide isomerase/thioredoxin